MTTAGVEFEEPFAGDGSVRVFPHRGERGVLGRSAAGAGISGYTLPVERATIRSAGSVPPRGPGKGVGGPGGGGVARGAELLADEIDHVPGLGQGGHGVPVVEIAGERLEVVPVEPGAGRGIAEAADGEDPQRAPGGGGGTPRKQAERGPHLAAGAKHDEGVADLGDEGDKFGSRPGEEFLESGFGRRQKHRYRPENGAVGLSRSGCEQDGLSGPGADSPKSIAGFPRSGVRGNAAASPVDRALRTIS